MDNECFLLVSRFDRLFLLSKSPSLPHFWGPNSTALFQFSSSLHPSQASTPLANIHIYPREISLYYNYFTVHLPDLMLSSDSPLENVPQIHISNTWLASPDWPNSFALMLPHPHQFYQHWTWVVASSQAPVSRLRAPTHLLPLWLESSTGLFGSFHLFCLETPISSFRQQGVVSFMNVCVCVTVCVCVLTFPQEKKRLSFVII